MAGNTTDATITGGGTATAKAKQSTKGRRKGAVGYTEGETRFLLTIVKQVKPYGPNLWEQVKAQMHAAAAKPGIGWPQREADRYKDKYSKLKNTKKATGKSSIPWDVKMAKSIAVSIDRHFCALQLDGQVDEHGNPEATDNEDDDEDSSGSGDGPGACGADASGSSSGSDDGTGTGTAGNGNGTCNGNDAGSKRANPASSNSARKRVRRGAVFASLVDVLGKLAAPPPPPPPPAARRRSDSYLARFRRQRS